MPRAAVAAPDKGAPSAEAVLRTLAALGWSCVDTRAHGASPDAAPQALMRERLSGVLRRHRFVHRGEPHALGEDGIARRVDELATAKPLSAQSTLRWMREGMALVEPVPGARRHATTAPLLEPAGGPQAQHWDALLLQGPGAPGVLCLLNGLPVAAIECADDLDRAIAQHGAPRWRGPLDAPLRVAIAPGLVGFAAPATPPAEWSCVDIGRPTEGAMLLRELLAPARLLPRLRESFFLDARGALCMARPAQQQAMQAVVEHLGCCERGTALAPGALVWQADGAGRAGTAVLLAQALRARGAGRPGSAWRLIVASARATLAPLFAANHLESALAIGPQASDDRGAASNALARRIGQGVEPLLLVPPSQLLCALRRPQCRNASQRIVVLLDDVLARPGRAWDLALQDALPHAVRLHWRHAAPPRNAHFGPLLHAFTAGQRDAGRDAAAQGAGTGGAPMPSDAAARTRMAREIDIGLAHDLPARDAWQARQRHARGGALGRLAGVLRRQLTRGVPEALHDHAVACACHALCARVAPLPWRRMAAPQRIGLSRQLAKAIDDALAEHSLDRAAVDAAIARMALPLLHGPLGLGGARDAVLGLRALAQALQDHIDE